MKSLHLSSNGIKINKRIEILLFIIIITGILGIFLIFDSFSYDLTLSNIHEKDNWVKLWTMKNYPNMYFNYWHGLWLMPMGVMFVFIVIMLQMILYPEKFI
jgi:hypothetical protein